MSLLTILLLTISVVFGQDFHVRLTHSSINKLIQYAIPMVTEHVESQRIPAQTVEGVLDLRIGTIIVRSFTFNMTLIFDADNQQIDTQITDLTLSFWPFRFSVEKTMTQTLGLKCNTLITASFTNWHFAFKFDPSVDDKCMIQLIINEQSISIQPGPININIQFLSDFCDSLFSTADYVLDLEKNIKNQIVEKMPEIITNDLQTAINDGLEQMRYLQGINIGLCYTHITITDIRFSIGGNFITNLDDLDFNWNIENDTIVGVQSFYFDEDIPQFTNAEVVSSSDYSQALIEILFVVFVVIAILCGMGCSYSICCCIYKPKFKKLEQYKKSNKNENEPMINDTSVAA